jgi:hypothetical protein
MDDLGIPPLFMDTRIFFDFPCIQFIYHNSAAKLGPSPHFTQRFHQWLTMCLSMNGAISEHPHVWWVPHQPRWQQDVIIISELSDEDSPAAIYRCSGQKHSCEETFLFLLVKISQLIRNVNFQIFQIDILGQQEYWWQFLFLMFFFKAFQPSSFVIASLTLW